MKSTVALIAGLMFLGLIGCTQTKTDVQYGTADGEKLLLDARTPSGLGPFPVVIIVHGGGWGSGDKAKDISVLFDPLEEAKFTTFSINYRLAPKHRWPACLEDVQTAIRWVKAHAKEFRGDPDRIAMFCYSASGVMVFLTEEDNDPGTQVQAVVGEAPVTDLEIDLEARGGLSPALRNLLDKPQKVTDESRKILHDLSPINHVRSGMPPVLLIQGDVDKTVWPKATENFFEALGAHKVQCELILVHGTPHNILKWEKIDTSDKGMMVAWLTKVLNAKPLAATTEPSTRAK